MLRLCYVHDRRGDGREPGRRSELKNENENNFVPWESIEEIPDHFFSSVVTRVYVRDDSMIRVIHYNPRRTKKTYTYCDDRRDYVEYVQIGEDWVTLEELFYTCKWGRDGLICGKLVSGGDGNFGGRN